MGNSAVKEMFLLDEFSLMKHDTSNHCMRFRTDGIRKCYVVFQGAGKR